MSLKSFQIWGDFLETTSVSVKSPDLTKSEEKARCGDWTPIVPALGDLRQED